MTVILTVFGLVLTSCCFALQPSNYLDSTTQLPAVDQLLSVVKDLQWQINRLQAQITEISSNLSKLLGGQSSEERQKVIDQLIAQLENLRQQLVKSRPALANALKRGDSVTVELAAQQLKSLEAHLNQLLSVISRLDVSYYQEDEEYTTTRGPLIPGWPTWADIRKGLNDLVQQVQDLIQNVQDRIRG